MSFGQGLSGLKAAAQRIDVIGNNIANSNTVGFKSSSVSFADVYASSRVGLGTQIAGVNQDFTVGNLSVTGGQFDIAIDGGTGLFRVVDSSGSVFFTRNGEFSPNKEGYLTNAQGHFLTGYVLNQETGAYSLQPEPIRLPTGNIAPLATGSNIENNPESGVLARAMNLDAKANPIDATIVFPNLSTAPNAPKVPDPSSYNMSVPMTVYDSLGREHQLTQYFRKTGENEWSVFYQLGSEIPANWQEHKIKFKSNGEIVKPDPDANPPITTDTSRTTLTFNITGAEPLVIPVNYEEATQFGGPFNYQFVQDGYPTGEYASMGVSADGTVVANYTNGEMLEVGYIVLADFPNMQGLSPVGGNAWAQSPDSGAPRLGRPGQNGLSTLMSQALEESNVDISTELVNMIITQRTYQANAQSITTQSEMMQNLLNIR